MYLKRVIMAVALISFSMVTSPAFAAKQSFFKSMIDFDKANYKVALGSMLYGTGIDFGAVLPIKKKLVDFEYDFMMLASGNGLYANASYMSLGVAGRYHFMWNRDLNSYIKGGLSFYSGDTCFFTCKPSSGIGMLFGWGVEFQADPDTILFMDYSMRERNYFWGFGAEMKF